MRWTHWQVSHPGRCVSLIVTTNTHTSTDWTLKNKATASPPTQHCTVHPYVTSPLCTRPQKFAGEEDERKGEGGGSQLEEAEPQTLQRSDEDCQCAQIEKGLDRKRGITTCKAKAVHQHLNVWEPPNLRCFSAVKHLEKWDHPQTFAPLQCTHRPGKESEGSEQQRVERGSSM